MRAIARGFAGLAVAAATAAGTAHAGRFQQFNEKFASAPDQAQVVGTTLFGGAGTEWFAGGGFEADGGVVAAGTCLGPALDAPVPVKVLGRDGDAPPAPQLEPQRDSKGNPMPGKFAKFSWTHPSATGFVARYSADLRTVRSVSRFPWRSGAITSAVVAADGSIYVCGPAGEAIGAIGGDVKELAVNAAAVEKPSCAATYLAKLAPGGDRVMWVRVMRAPSACPRLRLDQAGRVVMTGPDLRVFNEDGSVNRAMSIPGGLEGNVAISSLDGTIARGGEHHWPTGREPWRCPTLNLYRPDGTHLYQFYDWGGPYVGMDNLRLVSDSAIRGVMYDDEGNLLIHAWSDGGNSVMTRQPNDVRREHGAFDRSLGMSAWGAGVLSAAYVLRIETKDWRVTDGTLWLAYLAERDKPNSIWIDAFDAATDGSVCLAGRSATGLIRTGNAVGGGPPAGPYVAVLSRRLDSLRFSSDLPACGKTQVNDGPFGIARGVVNGRPRVMFLSGAVANEELYGQTLAPPAAGVQPKHGGGFADGHIIVLDLGGKP